MALFNGHRLKQARLYRGYTVEELAEKIQISKQAISQYETGKTEPTFDKLCSLAFQLRFPYEFFTQQNSHLVSSGSTYFRSLLKTSKKYRVEQTTKMEFLAQIYSFLNDYVEFPKLNLPSFSDDLTPEEAALKVREFWNLEERPILNIVQLLEKNGILVTTYETATDDIDAFSQLIQNQNAEMYLIALSKNKDTAARTHFDVAHELGHIILHNWNEDIECLSRDEFRQREKEANDFAAAFLLPEEAFRQEFHYVPDRLEAFLPLKKKWNVSIAAMLYRCCDLGIIDHVQYQNMMKKMQVKNWRKVEPFDNILQTAKPSLFRDAIAVLLENNVFSPDELVRELSQFGLAMNPNEIEFLLDLPEGTLKTNVQSKSVTLKDEYKNSEFVV